MRDKRDGAAVEGHREERVKALLNTYERKRALRAAMVISLVVSAGAATLMVARTASAQEWTKDRRLGDGKGYRTGDIELHPGLGAEFGYDSNYFLRSDKTGAALLNGAPGFPVEDGELLRITPSITINTVAPTAGPGGGAVEPEKYSFKGALSGSYYQFFGPKDLRDQGNNVSLNASARLDIYPGRPIGFAVFAGYSRVLKPSVDGNPDDAFNRDNINAGAEVIVTPGGGTFDVRAGYQFNAQLFEQSNGVPFTNFQHEIDVKTRWRFRPRTALFNDNSVSFVTYPNKATSINQLEDSTPVTTRFGITGLITPRFSALADIGYGTTLEQDAGNPNVSQYDSVIANAEATFYLSSNPAESDPGQVSLSVSTLSLGYSRDFQRSFLAGGYYGSDRGYAKLTYFFANKALISLNGGIGAIEYPKIFINTSTAGAEAFVNNAFTDIRLTTTLFGEYRILDSLGINATLDYSQNFSNTVLDYAKATGVGEGSSGTQYDMAWKRFQAILGVRYFL